MDTELKAVCEKFCLKGDYLGSVELKNGNINRTFRVDYCVDDQQKSYILQRVNTFVFKKPEQVMSNIDHVTEYLRRKDPAAVSLHFHHTPDRLNYVLDDDGGFWRLFNYVPSVTFNSCENLTVIRSAGEAFGTFQQLLADYPAEELYVTIDNFHNTEARYSTLMADAEADPFGKVKEVQDILSWLREVREQACTMTALEKAGELPHRVTHNDTKINNVLFDEKTFRPLVVIDLDTVMPGLVGHDFGDAIRFAANTVEEDSQNWKNAAIRLEVFRAFADGFLEKTAAALTENELNTLALSVFVISAEQTVRFLDDYIMGSVYFKCLYPEHNLVRARCQMTLAKDVLKHLDEMKQIVRECAAKYRS